MTLPLILTLTEAADFLGVATSDVAEWAMDDLLPVCARSESGELLFYRWRVERDGSKLAAGERVRVVKPRNDRRNEQFGKAGDATGKKPARSDRRVLLHDGHQMPCGCVLAADLRPAWLCPAARMLQTVQQMTELMAAAAPDKLFVAEVATAAAHAFANHHATANTPPADRALAPDRADVARAWSAQGKRDVA